MWQKILILLVGGGAGTLARYGLSDLANRITQGQFPWGTFAVNALGCFLFGVIAALAEERFVVSPQVRLLLLTGFMGAFTTFSTYAFETGKMLHDSQWLYGSANVIGQNVAGLALLLLGMKLGQWI